MPNKTPPGASVSDVFERVLDRGIVIDAWLRVSVAGITLLDVDARVVVASIDTYVQHSAAVAPIPLAARPAPRAPRANRAPRRPTPAPSGHPRSPVALRCASGCTFQRSARRPPARVRCPSERGRSCPVVALVS
jgi:hypothetical protein